MARKVHVVEVSRGLMAIPRIRDEVRAELADDATVVAAAESAAALAVDDAVATDPDIGALKTGTTGQVLGYDAGGATPVTVKGSSKTLSDLAGVTHFFVPALLDIRAYGAVTNNDAAAKGMSTAARRAANNAALQAATNDSITASTGSRRVYIPGGYGGFGLNDIYEFDQAILFPSGASFVTEHEEPMGARLHYYGAVNTHAFAPNDQYRSYVVFAGVRLEDKRGSAAATGTGAGLNTDYVTNGTHIENCFISGFYRNITTLQSDMVRISGGWIGPAYDVGIYLDQLGNFSYIDGIAFDIVNAVAPTQRAAIFASSSLAGMANTLNISNIKAEPDVAAAVGLWLSGLVPSTHVDGFSMRGTALADAVRITTTQTTGVGEEVILENVGVKAGGATNLLRVDHTVSGTTTTYTVPAHATQDSVIRRWDEGRRTLSYRGRNGYTYAQGTAGTSAPATVVPFTANAIGTGGTITVDGDDQQGVITITTGTGTAAQWTVLTMYFRVRWPRKPRGVVLSGISASAVAALAAGTITAPDPTGTHLAETYWQIKGNGATALTASTTYRFAYQVIP